MGTPRPAKSDRLPPSRATRYAKAIEPSPVPGHTRTPFHLPQTPENHSAMMKQERKTSKSHDGGPVLRFCERRNVSPEVNSHGPSDGRQSVPGFLIRVLAGKQTRRRLVGAEQSQVDSSNRGSPGRKTESSSRCTRSYLREKPVLSPPCTPTLVVRLRPRVAE